MNPTDYPPEALRVLVALSVALLGCCIVLSLALLAEACNGGAPKWRRIEGGALSLLFAFGAVAFAVLTAALVGAL